MEPKGDGGDIPLHSSPKYAPPAPLPPYESAWQIARRVAKNKRKAFRETKEASSKTSAFKKWVIWTLKTTISATTETATGSVVAAIFIALQFYVWFTLILVGTCWLLLKAVFLWSIPVLLKLTIPVVDAINGIRVVLETVLNAAVLGLRALEGVVNVIATIVDHGHRVFNRVPDYVSIPPLTDTEFRNTLRSIPPVCPKYNSAGAVFKFFTRHWMHPVTCPATRYTYPLRWLFNTLSTIFGSWTYYGGAEPYPNTPGQNCDGATDIGPADYICAVANGGWVVLEIILPFFIAVILLIGLRKAIYNYIRIIVYTAFLGTMITVEIVTITVDTIFE